MEKVILVSKIQFGYNKDFYEYAKHLSKKYEVLFICTNQNLEKYEIENIDIIYLSLNSGFRSKLELVKKIKDKMNEYSVKKCIINYFPLCSLVLDANLKGKIVLDIRTGTIESNEIKRRLKDRLLKYEISRFKSVSIISKSLSNRFNLKNDNIFILPLGADCLIEADDISAKDGDALKLLYIGTFDFRNIHETIIGFAKYISISKNTSATYDIIGFSSDETVLTKMNDLINALDVKDRVILHGRKKYDELKKYFKYANVGVSYIPITEYFDYQPATKTFEYLSNGMVCIATKTFENKSVINNECGVLINDSADEFASALVYLERNLKLFNFVEISEKAMEYSWEEIVKTKLIPLVES